MYLTLLLYNLSGGPEGLRALTNQKAIVTDRFPSLMQTRIPAAIDYPIRSLVRSWYVGMRFTLLRRKSIAHVHVTHLGNSWAGWSSSCMPSHGEGTSRDSSRSSDRRGEPGKQSRGPLRCFPSVLFQFNPSSSFWMSCVFDSLTTTIYVSLYWPTWMRWDFFSRFWFVPLEVEKPPFI